MKKKKINYHAVFEEERFYHIYNRGNNKENIFCEDKNHFYFLNQWNKYLSEFLEVYAYCLMPNHFHFLVRVSDEERLTKSLRFSKSAVSYADLDINKLLENQFKNFFISYSKSINKQQNRTGSLFQKRFKRILIDSNEYVIKLIHYIHHNPIHHQFTDSYQKWKFSSYSAILSDKSTKIKRTEVLEWFDGRRDFVDFHKMMYKYKDIENYIIE